jgi:hypothetical protein
MTGWRPTGPAIAVCPGTDDLATPRGGNVIERSGDEGVSRVGRRTAPSGEGGPDMS